MDGKENPPPKSMLTSWKFVASARSCTKAVDDAECTIFGKPQLTGLSCAPAGSDARHMARASDTKITDLLFTFTIPLNNHWISILSVH
jgi:hypothetical protein